MIFHPLLRLKEAGITQIAIVTSPEHMGDVVNLLGSGHELGLDLTFRVQDKPGGIAQALGLCENFAGGDSIVTVLGDNILEDSLAPHAHAYLEQGTGARVLLKEVPNPGQYGVAHFEQGKIVEIVEKPKNPPSSYAVVGIYFYDSAVFDFIRQLSPSLRGEYEVSDLNSSYVKKSHLSYGILDGWWGDAGTLEGWHEANRLAIKLVYDTYPGTRSS